VQLAAAQAREAALRSDKESLLQQLRQQAQTLASVQSTEAQLWEAMEKIKDQKQACVRQLQEQEEQLARWQAQAAGLRADSSSYQEELLELQRQVCAARRRARLPLQPRAAAAPARPPARPPADPRAGAPPRRR
jgi:uncharacterized coiled-coil DUF342 family protein